MSEQQQLSREDQILQLLTDELKLQNIHLELLTKQRDALIQCDRTTFAILHDEYESLLNDLELQARRRAASLPTNGADLQKEVETWEPKSRLKVTTLMKDLRWVVQRVQSQVGQIESMIKNDLRLVNFELNLIIGAMSRGPHYINTGAPMHIQTSRLFNRTI